MAKTEPRTRLMGVPAPVLYALAFIIGLVLDHFVPWRAEWLRHAHPIGWSLIAIGILLGPLSAVSFGIRRTTLNPIGQPSRLLTGGAFRITRNPMYLGLAVAYVGLCLVLGRIWPIVFLVGPIAMLDRLVIPFEEEQLRDAFGAEFSSYCERVGRWF